MGRGKRSGRDHRNRRAGGDETLVKKGVGAVDGFDFFLVCGEFALQSLAVVRPEENVGVIVDVRCIAEMLSRTANFIDDVVEEMKLKRVLV